MRDPDGTIARRTANRAVPRRQQRTRPQHAQQLFAMCVEEVKPFATDRVNDTRGAVARADLAQHAGSLDEVMRYRRAWANAAERTPHKQPTALEPEDFGER